MVMEGAPVRHSLSLFLAIALGLPVAGAAPSGERASEPAWLGILMGPAVDGGVQIVAVIPDGPAEQAGLREGDLLVGLGGVDIAAPEDLSRALHSVAAGTPLVVEILREGRQLRVDLKTGARPGPAAGPGPRVVEAVPPVPSAQRLQAWARVRWAQRLRLLSGLSLVAIPDELRVHYHAPAGQGVLVTRVEDSEAVRATGLRVGDVVVAVDGNVVRQPADFHSALALASPRATVGLHVVRDGKPLVLSYSPGPATELGALREPPANGEDSVVRIRLLEQERERLERRLRAIREELARLKGTR